MPARPNIILILADDLGFSDLGCYGSEIHTPNLDALAAEGVQFSQFYNVARCCPARASLLSGLYPHQAGIGHMVENRGIPAYQGFLSDRCVTIPEALWPAGYKTLMSGKWHVGQKKPHWPLDRGFERYFGLLSGASHYFSLSQGRDMALDDQPWTPPPGPFYMTDAFTAAALRFLDDHGRQPEPFFMYLAYTAPHWPLHAWPEDIARYRGSYRGGWDELRRRRLRKQIETGLMDARCTLTPRDALVPAWDEIANGALWNPRLLQPNPGYTLEQLGDPDFWDLRMSVYAAQVDRMDQGIGRVMAKLREVGADENTLVMFLSDNGGCAEEINRGKPGAPPGHPDSFISYGRPWANASNTPFRLYKHWVHEGGIATPFIARWPRGITARGINHAPAHLMDVMATCLDLSGAAYPATFRGRAIQPLEGQSLLPIFQTGARAGHAAICWEHEGNRAVRQGQWKLVNQYPDAWELYDLAADRTETENLASRHPERIAGMIEWYDRWAARCGVLPWKEVKDLKPVE